MVKINQLQLTCDLSKFKVSLFYRKTLCLLYCSNVGLTASELEEALLHRPEFSTLSRDELEAVWLVIRDFAIQVDGVYVLMNSAIRRTIHRLYIKDNDTKKSYHELLVSYFERKESSLRTSEEQPHHMLALKDFTKLRECAYPRGHRCVVVLPLNAK